MRVLRVRVALLVTAVLVVAACGGAPAGPTGGATAPRSLADVVKAASTEGKLNVAGPSNFGEENFRKLMAAFNAKYGTQIQGTFTSSGNHPEIVAKIVTELSTGGKPTWDAVLLNDTFIWTLVAEGDIAKPDYRSLFKTPDAALQFDGHAVAYAHQLILPVVNATLVPPADRPKTWDDVVDAKWKGRIGVHNAVHHLVRLSQLWGDERTTEYAKKLASLNPKIGLINETYKLLTLGETRLSFTQTNSQVDEGLRKGEPIAWASDVLPAIAASYQCAGVKDAVNANVAALFCGFMLEKAATDIWGNAIGRQSIFDPSTTLGAIYAKNAKDVLVLDGTISYAQFQEREKKYRQLLGFR